MYRSWILVLFLSPVFYGQGQELSTLLEEVKILRSPAQDTKTQTLSREQIRVLQPEDAGQLLQKFAGVTLKSYGGLGGMKTISVRGIGGNHTGIVVDGFILQNNQTGQIDLSNIQTENIESITLSMGGADGYLPPVSACLGGSTVSIQTFENRFSADTFQLRAALKGGSYGQADAYLSAKYNREKYFFSLFGKYRRADGAYPFSFDNGYQLYEGNRFNNDLQEGFGGFSAGFRPNSKSLLKLNYQFNQSNKGLPGAVILYNPSADQRLRNASHQLNADYRLVFRGAGIRTYVSGRYEDLNYIDSAYLNMQGFLDQTYYNASVQHGIVFQTSSTGRFPVFGGIEQNYSELHSSVPNFARPERYHLKSVLGSEKKWDKLLLMAQLGGQAVFDKTETGNAARNKYVFTPYALVQARQQSVFGMPRFWVKRTFRMPTFNELYYNQIGNTALKPEIANQVNLGTSYEFDNAKNGVKIGADVYFNLVENKIVAIPTKNLFIWSMQNVGNAQILGTDILLAYSRKYKEHWIFSGRLTYTFQQVRDVSDKNSPTYGDQLPYLPLHTGNGDLTVTYKNSGFNLSALLTSERYALNENIPANQVDGFCILDAALFHTFRLSKAQQLRLSLNVRNITNQSYAFVRYYVMPGTNFLISVNYAFH